MATAPKTPAPEVEAEVVAPVKAPKAPKDYIDGDKLLVTACVRDQVNDLTGQRIAHGGQTVVVYDRWIEIQLDAGVLVEVEL